MKPQHLEPYDSVLATIGWTPLIRLARVGAGLETPVFGKAEYANPGGSVKDRIGLAIIEAAEKRGELRPGGTVVLEEVDTASLHHLPAAPAFDRLKPLVIEAFRKAGGDPDAAATQLEVFRSAGIEPNLRAEIQALPPGHPALQEPLQYLTALDGLLRSLMDPDELERLRAEAERELKDPGRWGLDFTLVQVWGRRRT